MKRYDFTVVGTAATVSVLRVEKMPECGKSTPVMGDGFLSYSNGGMGFNICAGLTMLGESVYPVLTYADARQREYLHRFAAEHGLPEDGLHDPPAGAAGTTIMIQDSKKNHMTLITGYENRMPDSLYYGHQAMEPRFFTNSRMVVLTAPMAMNTASAIRAIRESGTPLAFSMRKDPIALPHDLLWQALELTQILFANESEVDYLKNEFGLAEIQDLFRLKNMRHIVETLGEKGSRIYSRGENGVQVTRAKAVPAQVKDVETVGAGDAYVSGFLYGYIRGKSIAECARLGGTASSFVLEKEGSVTNLPTEEQLLARYEASIIWERERE